MIVTSIHEASKNLPRLIDKAASGEEIVIAKAGKAVAKLVAYRPSAEPRKPGLWRGQVRISKDFDSLPEDLLAAFNGDSHESDP